MRRITVLLVEYHAIVREAYRLMLELRDDLCVVGEAQDGRQAVEIVKKLHSDVVLMAIAMPHLNGLEAARQISKTVPTTKVLLLSDSGEEAYVTKAIESGAVGYFDQTNLSPHHIPGGSRSSSRKNAFQPSHLQAS